MSYGTGVGETYLSEVTIGFLEDTGQYRFVNGTGGRLVADIGVSGQCNETGSTATIDFLFGNTAGPSVRTHDCTRVVLCTCIV